MIELPTRPGRGATAPCELDRVVRQIIDGWEQRKQGSPASPQESANGFLKQHTYRLICHYIAHGAEDFFAMVLRENGHRLFPSREAARNPFHNGIRAMFIDDAVLSRAERHLYASQMLYAYRHMVPPEHLVGFIYQCGSAQQLRRKLKAEVIEAGFEALKFRPEVSIKVASKTGR